MFSTKKSNPQIDQEQLELIQNAQKRIRQKKRLYTHFVIFLIGSVLFIVLNLVLGFGEMLNSLIPIGLFTPFWLGYFYYCIILLMSLLLINLWEKIGSRLN